MNNYKNFLTRVGHALAALLMLVSVSSCERDMDMDIVSVTPPELHVIVYNGTDTNDRVEGATVKVYASEENRTAGTNAVAEAVTDASGEAVFPKEKFVKGINYLTVSIDDVTLTAQTPYMLQNDGETLFWVAKN
ncbi:hypothetical protein [Pontibacter mangrovi]|uniref:Uncharacterized protein n=1 Tax=Pontibacter mangrovi TaxID=2589816 RepID=A0A501W294_9BACT|nr:hypothetical protein [Pontibacter mangrovi]TPE44043.1 hypothetical protein FJM65_11525 [Pontibacter mangrovi]